MKAEWLKCSEYIYLYIFWYFLFTFFFISINKFHFTGYKHEQGYTFIKDVLFLHIIKEKFLSSRKT